MTVSPDLRHESQMYRRPHSEGFSNPSFVFVLSEHLPLVIHRCRCSVRGQNESQIKHRRLGWLRNVCCDALFEGTLKLQRRLRSFCILLYAVPRWRACMKEATWQVACHDTKVVCYYRSLRILTSSVFTLDTRVYRCRRLSLFK